MHVLVVLPAMSNITAVTTCSTPMAHTNRWNYISCSVSERCTDKTLADYRSANNPRLTTGQLPINTKSYKNLTFLSFEIEKKLLIVIPALWITVKPVFGDHPFVVIVSLWLLSVCHPVSSRTAECRQNKNAPTNKVIKQRNALTFTGNNNRPIPL